MTRILGAMIAIGVAALPAAAFAEEANAPGPQKLTDAQLDDVVGGAPPAFVLAAGHGPPAFRYQEAGTGGTTTIGTQVNFTIQDVTLVFNVGSNSDVNLAAALQLSVLSQQPQAASATAAQSASH